tara:strand:+ start:285590 stop:285772 length:183 start_codon:yes stop_codon:yes gene_type:complete
MSSAFELGDWLRIHERRISLAKDLILAKETGTPSQLRTSFQGLLTRCSNRSAMDVRFRRN